MLSKETNIGATPNGGVKSEIYYFNDKNEAVDKKVATKVTIRELDKDGNLIYENFMSK
jgi:hypothetical protein